MRTAATVTVAYSTTIFPPTAFTSAPITCECGHLLAWQQRVAAEGREAERTRAVPTGIAIRDPRQQLFDAAERVLLGAGPAALTSRAVTEEAGVAKGVLHRHFADFDAFLADYLIDRARRVAEQDERLRARAGQGDLADNLAEALTGFFGSVARHVLALVTFRDGLRARLRAAGVPGLPVLTECTRMVAGYLDVERALGRLPAGLDPELKALMLVGSAQLVFAGRDDEPPSFSEVRRFVVEALGLG